MEPDEEQTIWLPPYLLVAPGRTHEHRLMASSTGWFHCVIKGCDVQVKTVEEADGK